MIRGQRLRVGDIEGSVTDPAVLQRLVEGIRVHDRAPGGVHKNRRRLHHRKLPPADHVAGFLGQRGMDADEIGFPEERFQVHLPCVHVGDFDPLGRSVVVEHLHAEPGRPAGNRLPDPSHADNPKRRPVHIVAQEQQRVPGAPFPGLHVLGPFDDPAGGSHQ